MDDGHDREDSEENEGRMPMALAMGAAFGTAFGVLIFALTGDAIWLALSPGFGVTVGLLYHVISTQT
jgi:hypothetical protein